MDIQSLAALSDADLLKSTKRLAVGESRATAALIAHLSEIETRKLYLGEACSSLFTYCIQVLRLSEPAAYNRIQAARLARRFPAVLASLEQGAMHLAAVRLLAPVLTPENQRDLLASAAHKSKREVEELVARLRPQPDVPGRVRRLPARTSVPAHELFERPEASQPAPGTRSNGSEPKPAPAVQTVAPRTPAVQSPAAQARSHEADTAQPKHAQASPPQHATVVPIAPERYKVQFTASAAIRDKLRRAQELLRHRIPDGDVARVIDVALDLLVRDLERRKFAAADRPRLQPASQTQTQAASQAQAQAQSQSQSQPPFRSPSRYIPAGVRRAVWERDGGQCTFVNANGVRCTERGALEFDHIHPHADGGGVELQNVRLLCRQHNQYEARQFFGLWHTEQASQPTAPYR